MCTHSYLSKNEIINNNIENLAKLADGIGDPAVRQMGTIGGSIANSDPAADWPAAILALRSSIKTNNRTIQNKDLFTGINNTLKIIFSMKSIRTQKHIVRPQPHRSLDSI